MKYKKLIKTILIFLVIIPAFNSCESVYSVIRNRNAHKKHIQKELSKYSDVLDLNRTEIYLNGHIYYFFNSSAAILKLTLYLKPGCNNRETIIGIRDKQVAFFGADHWGATKIYSYPNNIAIEIFLEEEEKVKNIYTLYHSSDLYFGDNEWFERWRDDPQDSSGTPFMRRNIRNKEFAAFLENHADILDIEHSGGFCSGTGFIRISLYIFMDTPYNQNKNINKINDDLKDFFNTYHENLAEEYGPFNRMDIIFYNDTEAGLTQWISIYHGEEYQWEGKRWSW